MALRPPYNLAYNEAPPPETPQKGVSSFDLNLHNRLFSPGLQAAPVKAKKPSEMQIGGDHYKLLAIQPMEYALANRLNYAQANAIKYITRYNLKADGSKWKQDLEKAIHGLQMLIEWEEKERHQ